LAPYLSTSRFDRPGRPSQLLGKHGHTYGVGFRAHVSGLRVQGSGRKTKSVGCKVEGLGVTDLDFGVSGIQIRI